MIANVYGYYIFQIEQDKLVNYADENLFWQWINMFSSVTTVRLCRMFTHSKPIKMAIVNVKASCLSSSCSIDIYLKIDSLPHQQICNLNQVLSLLLSNRPNSTLTSHSTVRIHQIAAISVCNLQVSLYSDSGMTTVGLIEVIYNSSSHSFDFKLDHILRTYHPALLCHSCKVKMFYRWY